MKVKNRYHRYLYLVLFLVLLPFATAQGQEINLDKLEKCGDLLCYQSLDDSNVYHYLPDQPRLAIKDGRPQFSFLKYARTKGTGKAGIGRAEGGGIVHFLVTYGADEARVKAAEKDLQEKHSEARIAGPIVYRRGSFALITSFKEGAETLTRTVAVGKAPLMEGQKAAVSMALTREGAELLWESFKSATPDISLVFDMEFAGVREPYEAKLEADWKRVSNHHRVKAGLKYGWFGADVDMLFQELRQSGAIKITTKGEDKNLDKIIQSVHAKLLKVMFDPAPSDELTKAAAEKDSYSNLNQAVKMLKDAATQKKGRSSSISPWLEHFFQPVLKAIRRIVLPAFAAEVADVQFNKDELQEAKKLFYNAQELYLKKDYEGAIEKFRESNSLFAQVTGQENGMLLFNIAVCLHKFQRCEEAIDTYRQALSLLSKTSDQADVHFGIGQCLEKIGFFPEALASYQKVAVLAASNSEVAIKASKRAVDLSAKVYSHARRLDEEAKKAKYQPDATRNALEAYREYIAKAKPTGQRANEVNGRIRFLEQKLAAVSTAVTKTKDEKKIGTDPSHKAASSTSMSKPALKASTLKKSPKKAVPTSKSKNKKSYAKPTAKRSKKAAASTKSKPKKTSSAAKARKSGSPGFSMVASYRMKRIKRSGHFVYHLNHYRTENQAFAMAENIGDLYRRYGQDARVFRAVTIDDPVFKQREVLVTLDGQDAATFTKHLNFVTVQMEKRHQSGKVTTDEVVITPEKFNSSGNAFVLSYGWKGDDDRTAWLNYRVKTLWSFHGGFDVYVPWTTYDSAMLSLQPPHRYLGLTIEGQGDRLTRAKVRHAVVTVTSRIGERQVTTQATIRNQGPAPSLMLNIPEDKEGPNSEVTITWYLEGGKKITGPACLLEGDIVYWDEVPKGGGI